MEKFLCEGAALKKVVEPQSLASGVTGGRVDMTNAKRVAFVLDVGAGSSTSAHSIVIKQHDAASVGNSHDLEVAHPYYHKIDTETKFTKVEVDTATATYDIHSLLGDDVGLVVFEVLAEDLRSDCKWVSVNVGATAGTQIGAVLAVVDHHFKPAYTQEV